MNTHLRRIALALPAGLLICSAAMAAPINYDEAVDGDLVTGYVPLTVFALDYGTNTVSGTVGQSGPYGYQYDGDSFAFTVPVGMQVTEAGFSLADTLGDMYSVTWRLFVGSVDFRGGDLIQGITALSPGSISMNNAYLPLDPNSYNMSLNGYSYTPNPESTGQSSYTFTFEVVPEPSSLALLGLGGLLIARRRRG